MSQVWRVIKTDSVIRQLQKTLKAGQHHVFKNRDIIYQSIDAILIRASLIYFNNHAVIINEGGIEVLLQLLEILKGEEDIVDLIFRLLVTLLHEDNKFKEKMKIPAKNDDEEGDRQRQQQEQQQEKHHHHYNPHLQHYRLHRTAATIHLIGDEGIIEELTNAYQDHEQIRILGKSILKDLFEAENFAAMVCLRQVQEAVKYSIPFQLYAEINQKIIIPRKLKNIMTKEAGNNDDDERQHIPGILGVQLIQSHMLQFPNSENVQLIGLDIILKCLDDNNHLYDFIDQNYASILLHSITMVKFEVKWRAYVALMKLSTSREMCKHIEKQKGFKIILNELQQWFDDEKRNKSVLQLALWSLSNICKLDTSLHTLIQLGLKPLLFKIMEYSHNNPVVIPLDLQQLFPKANLEVASRFETTDASTLLLEAGYVDETHQPDTVKTLLPPPKNAKPSYGTTLELFQGQSGLI